MVSGVGHFKRWKNTSLSMADILAVLKSNKTLQVSDVFRKNPGKSAEE